MIFFKCRRETLRSRAEARPRLRGQDGWHRMADERLSNADRKMWKAWEVAISQVAAIWRVTPLGHFMAWLVKVFVWPSEQRIPPPQGMQCVLTKAFCQGTMLCRTHLGWFPGALEGCLQVPEGYIPLCLETWAIFCPRVLSLRIYKLSPFIYRSIKLLELAKTMNIVWSKPKELAREEILPSLSEAKGN